MFKSFGPTELLIILAIVLLLFGASRLPKLARGLGEGFSELKKGLGGGRSTPEEPVVAAKPSLNGHQPTQH